LLIVEIILGFVVSSFISKKAFMVKAINVEKLFKESFDVFHLFYDLCVWFKLVNFSPPREIV
jgi:hypothetical protein